MPSPEKKSPAPQAQAFSQLSNGIISTVSGVLSGISQQDFEQLLFLITGTERIFLCGAGRSGLIGRCFAMRLMHLGKTVYLAGDTTTPALLPEDLLILISASGTTPTVLAIAGQAQKTGAGIVLLTSAASPTAANHLCHYSRFIISFPAATPAAHSGLPALPLGTTFELSVLLFLESIISGMLAAGQIPAAGMQARHANLE